MARVAPASLAVLAAVFSANSLLASAECVNDPTWFAQGNYARDCDWVAQKPGTRCNSVVIAHQTTGETAKQACKIACKDFYDSPTCGTADATDDAADTTTDATTDDAADATTDDTTDADSTALPACENNNTWSATPPPGSIKMMTCAWANQQPPKRCVNKTGLQYPLVLEKCPLACFDYITPAVCRRVDTAADDTAADDTAADDNAADDNAADDNAADDNAADDTAADDTAAPTTLEPTTLEPTTLTPTWAPTRMPTGAPSSIAPTLAPSKAPTIACGESSTWIYDNKKSRGCSWVGRKTKQRCQLKNADGIKAQAACAVTCTGCVATVPTMSPSHAPTSVPTIAPTELDPTNKPTVAPTMAPTNKPTAGPTVAPTASTYSPTQNPSGAPSNAPTTPVPTIQPTPLGGFTCKDSSTWSHSKNNNRKCSWVAEKPAARCKPKVVSSDGTTAVDACQLACDNCPTAPPSGIVDTPAPVQETTSGPVCTDSSTWTHSVNAQRTCAWVADKVTTRCRPKVVSSDGVSSSDACPVSCGTCPDPADDTDAPADDTDAPATDAPTDPAPTGECADSSTWYEQKSSVRTCQWVAGKIEFRCKSTVVSTSGVPSDVGCPVTCGTCSPDAETTTSPEPEPETETETETEPEPVETPAPEPVVTPAPEPMSYCTTGILNTAGTVCCPAACGMCGGKGCQDAPGGRSQCCGKDVTKNGVICATETSDTCTLP